jgi:hypothetical protein
MSANKDSTPFQLGDRVKIRHSMMRGRIVELRGPLGPGGANIYRIRLREQQPAYIEVREDQLVRLPAPAPRHGPEQARKTRGS